MIHRLHNATWLTVLYGAALLLTGCAATAKPAADSTPVVGEAIVRAEVRRETARAAVGRLAVDHPVPDTALAAEQLDAQRLDLTEAATGLGRVKTELAEANGRAATAEANLKSSLHRWLYAADGMCLLGVFAGLLLLWLGSPKIGIAIAVASVGTLATSLIVTEVLWVLPYVAVALACLLVASVAWVLWRYRNALGETAAGIDAVKPELDGYLRTVLKGTLLDHQSDVTRRLIQATGANRQEGAA